MRIVLSEIVLECKEFYSGKTYVHQGECFPVVTGDKEEVKIYTSRNRADIACSKLNLKVGRNFIVDEIE